MKEYFQAEVKEDCIIFTLTELATRISKSEIKHELEEYLDNMHETEERESDLRLAEIEECYCKYAQLLMDHINVEKDLPLHSSYSLNV